MRLRPLVAACAAALQIAAVAAAGEKRLSIDDIYDPEKRTNFDGTRPAGLTWIDASHYASPRDAADGIGVDWVTVDTASGRTQPLFDAAKMEAALTKLPGVTADEARRQAHARGLTFNSQHSAALMTIAGGLCVYTVEGDRAVRLTRSAGDEELASFSPDGRLVATASDDETARVWETASGLPVIITNQKNAIQLTITRFD